MCSHHSGSRLETGSIFTKLPLIKWDKGICRQKPTPDQTEQREDCGALPTLQQFLAMRSRVGVRFSRNSMNTATQRTAGHKSKRLQAFPVHLPDSSSLSTMQGGASKNGLQGGAQSPTYHQQQHPSSGWDHVHLQHS